MEMKTEMSGQNLGLGGQVWGQVFASGTWHDELIVIGVKPWILLQETRSDPGGPRRLSYRVRQSRIPDLLNGRRKIFELRPQRVRHGN